MKTTLEVKGDSRLWLDLSSTAISNMGLSTFKSGNNIGGKHGDTTLIVVQVNQILNAVELTIAYNDEKVLNRFKEEIYEAYNKPKEPEEIVDYGYNKDFDRKATPEDSVIEEHTVVANGGMIHDDDINYDPDKVETKTYWPSWAIVLLLFFFGPIGTIFMWLKASWGKAAKIILTIIFCGWFVLAIVLLGLTGIFATQSKTIKEAEKKQNIEVQEEVKEEEYTSGDVVYFKTSSGSIGEITFSSPLEKRDEQNRVVVNFKTNSKDIFDNKLSLTVKNGGVEKVTSLSPTITVYKDDGAYSEVEASSYTISKEEYVMGTLYIATTTTGTHTITLKDKNNDEYKISIKVE